MNKWMSAAMGSLMLAGASLAHATITDDPAQVADQVFRSGVEFCNAAAKGSRSDSKQARSDFNQYLSYFERASTIFPALLEQNSFAERENRRCLQIGDNIARAEALPIIEKSLAMCQDAKAALNAGNLDATRIRFSQYEMNRDRALRMSESILKVGSIAVQVRICNGLTDKIAAVERQNNSYTRMARSVVAELSKARDTCAIGEKMAFSGEISAEKRAVMQEIMTQAQSLAAQVESTAANLSKVGAQTVGRSLEQIQALQLNVHACEQAITAAINQPMSDQAVATTNDPATDNGQDQVPAGAQPGRPVTELTLPESALVHNGGADL